MTEEDAIIRCDECTLPAAKIVGTALVIQHKHYGEKHKTVVEITELISLVSEKLRQTKEVLAGRCVK